MRSLLEVHHLSYCHPNGTAALTDISLQMPVGTNLVLFGPNGSGKTTFLLHLNGTLLGQGSIQVDGIEVKRGNLTEIRRTVGLVFQEADDQLFMPTVLEDVMFGLLNLGWTPKTAEIQAKRTLAQVGINEGLFSRAPFHLSAGEKRRVALAGVLAMEPKLLLLDEPTTSLDPPGQRALVQILKALPQSKIIATHDAHFARCLSDRAMFMESGRLIADGDVDQLIKQFSWDPYS
jgi:cobalt/nickel transport system ATP-binding protein